MRTPAFTIVELLVVITIIVVLLALLTPALDKAIYQAELAVCGTAVRGVASAAIVYATDHKRRYPYRDDIHGSQITYGNSSVNNVRDVRPGINYDMRARMKDYWSLKLLVGCPLSKAVDLEDNGSLGNTMISADYALFFGWQYFGYTDSSSLGQGMHKVGDRLVYNGDRYSVLAADIDSYDIGNNISWASHPDNVKLGPMVWQNWGDPGRNPNSSAAAYGSLVGDPTFSWTWSRYDSCAGGQQAEPWYRGPLDDNFAFSDGSVTRYNGVALNHAEQQPDDERMGHVGFYRHGMGTQVILPLN